MGEWVFMVLPYSRHNHKHKSHILVPEFILPYLWALIFSELEPQNPGNVGNLHPNAIANTKGYTLVLQQSLPINNFADCNSRI